MTSARSSGEIRVFFLHESIVFQTRTNEEARVERVTRPAMLAERARRPRHPFDPGLLVGPGLEHDRLVRNHRPDFPLDGADVVGPVAEPHLQPVVRAGREAQHSVAEQDGHRFDGLVPQHLAGGDRDTDHVELTGDAHRWDVGPLCLGEVVGSEEVPLDRRAHMDVAEGGRTRR